jgi:NAD(P)H-hydrate repair Nnr-like enzyme with NAD(P)H-hydrate epimerase domain
LTHYTTFLDILQLTKSWGRVMKLVTVAQMREIEKEADANGLPYAEMMENAGRGLAEIVNEIAFDDEWEEVLGLVGPGNNGGDTLVALTHLVEDGWHARGWDKESGKPLREKLVELRLQDVVRIYGCE